MLGAIFGVVGFARIIVWQMLWQTYGQHYLLIALTIAFSLLGVATFGNLRVPCCRLFFANTDWTRPAPRLRSR
jgi:hypothetical protein